MKRQTTWKNLSCDLTPDEVATYSLELANITIECNKIEAAKKEVVSNYAARINKCNADAAVLSLKVQTRKEDRKVECDLDFGYAKGMVYTVRTDTGVTIGQRKLTDDERQQWLDLDAEEGRRQEAEDKREAEAAPDNVIEGELLQIEHKPEIDICGNTECHYHDATEGNGCKQYEMVWECKQAVQETEEKGCNIDQQAVMRLVCTSADDCKTSLNFVTDLDVLHEALEQCTVRGEKTNAKYISSRINQLEKAVKI